MAIICMAGSVCILLRAFPFLLFGRKKPPLTVIYLGRVLSAATIAVLVVYCLGSAICARPEIVANVPVAGPESWQDSVAGILQVRGLAEFLAAGIVASLHWWLKRPVLAIFAGTAAYMLMVQAAGA